MGAQLALCALGWFVAFAIVYEFRLTPPVLDRFVDTVGILVVLRLLLLHRFQLDHGLWRHVGLQDLLRLAGATVAGSNTTTSAQLPGASVPRSARPRIDACTPVSLCTACSIGMS